MEFGEYSVQTIQREYREEIGSGIENLGYWQTLENVFIFEGSTGHEIVLVFQGDLTDKSIYYKPFIYGMEDNGQPFKALWKTISDFEGGPPLYFDGLLELLTE